jgi:hypothetical protein
MDNDADTQRIRARLNNYASPEEIIEEGYRVCRLNVQLRRDLEEAQRKLQSGNAQPATVKNKAGSGASTADVASIKKKLDGGGSATNLAAEAYRVCRVNDELREKVKGTDGQKKRIAVMEDALSEASPSCTNYMWHAR